MIAGRCTAVKTSSITIRPPPGSPPSPVTACLDLVIVVDRDRQHLHLQRRAPMRPPTSGKNPPPPGAVSGLKMTPTRFDAGAIFLSSSIHLPPIGRFEIGEAGDVAAGMRQVGDKAIADRIGHRNKDDRDCRSLVRHRLSASAWSRTTITSGFKLDQFLGIAADPLDFADAKTIGDRDVVTVLPAELFQRLPERRHARLGIGHRLARIPSAMPMPECVLLRARRACRRYRRAPDQADELAPFHSRHPAHRALSRRRPARQAITVSEDKTTASGRIAAAG